MTNIMGVTTIYTRQSDGQILHSEYVTTPKQRAEVGSFFAWDTRIQATVTGTLLHVEYHHPTIADTEWQGGLVTAEQRPMLLSIDGAAPVDLPIVNGQGDFILSFNAPGTYQLVITAGFGCEPTTLEVTV